MRERKGGREREGGREGGRKRERGSEGGREWVKVQIKEENMHGETSLASSYLYVLV